MDKEAEASGQHDSHYNQQGASLRSDSLTAPSRSALQPRPASPRHREDADGFGLHNGSNTSFRPVTASSSASPASNVHRDPHKKTSGSRWAAQWKDGNRRMASRNGSTWDNLNEIEAPRPVQNPDEDHVHPRDTLEARYSRRRSALLGRRTSPPSSDLDITALPTVGDEDDEDNTYTLHAPSRRLTHLYTASHLVFFAIWGTLARLGLQWLTFYPGAPITFSVLWANVAGTFFIGFLAEDRRLFQSHAPARRRPDASAHAPPSGDEEKVAAAEAKSAHTKLKKQIPLYIGLATGFCGSFTSISSFLRDLFLAFTNDLHAPHNHLPAFSGSPTLSTTNLPRAPGHSFSAGLSVLLPTTALSFSALTLGAHLALALDPVTPPLPARFSQRFLDPLVALLAWPAWLGAIFLAIWPPDRHAAAEHWRGDAVFAVVFAPLGCLLRFWISARLNPLLPSFPLGTFTVNIFGTAVLGMAWDLQHASLGSSGGLVGGGRIGCQVLQGVMDGFCGALTTVSTWVLEVVGLRRRHGYVYAVGSVGVGLGVLVVVMGSVRWSVGWSAAVCVG